MIPPMLTFARLTIWEAARRKLLIAIALLTLVIIAGTGWGFTKIAGVSADGQPPSPVEVRLVASQLLTLVAFLFSGVLALSAVLVAAPSVSSDIETNLALAMLARPVRRADYLLGKWVGLGVLVVGYAAVSGALEMLVVAWATGYVPPHPLQLVAFIAAEGLVLLTVALLFSTRLAGMTGGIIALVLWFIAWIGGILEGIGRAFDNGTLTNVGLATRLIIPTDALWRGAVYALEPATVIAAARQAGRVASATPFVVTDPIQPAMLAWIAVWVTGILVLAVWSLRVREV